MQKSVHIASGSVFLRDAPGAVSRMLKASELKYIIFDYRSTASAKPLAGHRVQGQSHSDVGEAIGRHLEATLHRGVRIVASVPELNSNSLVAEIRALAEKKGLRPKLVAVPGDGLAADGLWSQPKLNKLSASADLGARGIARALAQGVDIVIVGPCAGSTVVLGLAVHEFGWRWDDYDRLSAACLAGHVIESATHCTGAGITEWQSTEPQVSIVAFSESGRFRVSDVSSSGAIVTAATVAQQIVYAIGDPGAIELPDVCCDWRSVALKTLAPNVIEVGRASGRAPGGRTVICATETNDFETQTDKHRTGDHDGESEFVRLETAADAPEAEYLPVALSQIAFACGSNQGNDVHIGVVARDPAHYAELCLSLTSEVVQKLFIEYLDDHSAAQVRRYFIPPLNAISFVVTNCLGPGNLGSLTVDPNGKAYAQRLLKVQLPLPIRGRGGFIAEV